MGLKTLFFIWLALTSMTSWCHSLDELSLTVRQSNDGILLRGSIGQVLEPSSQKALEILRSEFVNLDFFLDGNMCEPHEDFIAVEIEKSLQSTVATQSFRCPGNFHVLKIKPKTTLKWRTSIVLVSDGNWTSDFLETTSHEVILKTKSSRSKTFVTYFKEGFSHLAMGFDHILFLLIVMFGVFLERQSSQTYSPKKALLVGARDLTFFTLGHALATIVSTLADISLNAGIVEPLIALTIAFSGMALSHHFPWKRRHLHFLVVPFGFIHGLSFAYALTDRGLILKSSWEELISFNVGLEFCQILIFVGSLLFVLSMPAKFSRQFTETRLSLVFSIAGFFLFGMSLLKP
ncbi:MAG: HupE/UreJ family protein [Pseudomonadota bacterium]